MRVSFIFAHRFQIHCYGNILYCNIIHAVWKTYILHFSFRSETKKNEHRTLYESKINSLRVNNDLFGQKGPVFEWDPDSYLTIWKHAKWLSTQVFLLRLLEDNLQERAHVGFTSVSCGSFQCCHLVTGRLVLSIRPQRPMRKYTVFILKTVRK